MPQPPETRDDVERDVIVGRTASKPVAATVCQLHLADSTKGARRFVIEPIRVEQNPDIAAR
jgi:hypothetical protein